MLLLDVRDPTSFGEARIDGAVRVTFSDLGPTLAGTPKDQPILIYCYHGNASQEYAQAFSDFGFSQVYSLDGGFEAWRQRTPAAKALPAELDAWLQAQGFTPGAVEATIANGTTPLMHAAHTGALVMARALIAAGARLNARNADGNTALWLACVGRHFDMIDLLVESGIDLDTANDNGATALMYASSAGLADVVARLLERGADIRPETLDGFTALDLAGNVECLTLLRRASQAQAVVA
ncbi:ankyrin repeat domain-containing protein [Roseixanthobacter glucoisosaccharinicivorans]|uniref:ankyrin repeat domain-containing protein n=1 Tax=Roseixanthobacter glucoisosaccharinicivorans TaxID=3119923 RepID=UPI003726E3C3